MSALTNSRTRTILPHVAGAAGAVMVMLTADWLFGSAIMTSAINMKAVGLASIATYLVIRDLAMGPQTKSSPSETRTS